MSIRNIFSSQAKAKYVCMSSTKVRRVLNQVRGVSYENALMLLEFLPYHACKPVWKVIKSAAANIRNIYNIKEQNIFIDEIFVTPGPTLKRFRPRAQGNAYAIRKPTCHITVIITVKDLKILKSWDKKYIR